MKMNRKHSVTGLFWHKLKSPTKNIGSKHSHPIEKLLFHLTHYANILILKDHTSSE